MEHISDKPELKSLFNIDDCTNLFGRINQFTDGKNKNNLKWLRISLIHRSASHAALQILAENGLTHGIFNYLKTLGSQTVNLIISYYIIINSLARNRGEASLFVSNHDIKNKIFDFFDLETFVKTGYGVVESEKSSSKFKDILSSQFIGALLLDIGFDNVRKIISPLIDNTQLTSGKKDYKTLLQEITQKHWKTLPQYVLLRIEGPAHNQKFVTCVTVQGIGKAEGIGNSKVISEHTAAETLLKKLQIKLNTNNINLKNIQNKESQLIQAISIPKNESFCRFLCKKWNVDSINYLLFSLALTHSSSREWSKNSGLGKDNTKLAFLGSHVISFLASYFSITSYLELSNSNFQDNNLAYIIREINNKNNLAAIFDQLNLQQYVLSGPGELPPYSTETRSDIIQSLFGAALIAHKGDIELCRESIPLQLKNKFDLTIKKLFSTPVREIKDPKTNLQEICQIIGIDIRYAPLPLGDNFKKYRKEQYKAQIEFNSPILQEKLIFFNSDILDSTRKGAEQILAAQALEILNAINNKLVLPKFKGLSYQMLLKI